MSHHVASLTHRSEQGEVKNPETITPHVQAGKGGLSANAFRSVRTGMFCGKLSASASRIVCDRSCRSEALQRAPQRMGLSNWAVPTAISVFSACRAASVRAGMTARIGTVIIRKLSDDPGTTPQSSVSVHGSDPRSARTYGRSFRRQMRGACALRWSALTSSSKPRNSASP